MIEFNNPDINFWKNKSVLITGHNGFKGSWLSLWLLEMHAKVIGISLENICEISLFEELGIVPFIDHNIVDVTEKEKINELILKKQPDIVFHLAAQTLVIESYKKPIRTWDVNVMGTINVLNALRNLKKKCAVVFITTDKVYENKNLQYAFRENDPLGGSDPYSASKAACEIAINAWKNSFCGNRAHQNKNIFIASARAGNVIGGGDWANDRILPDIVRFLKDKKKIEVRNPQAVRPWQHVIEPLSGYLLLAEYIYKTETNNDTNFNFGPLIDSNQPVGILVDECLKYWQGSWIDISKNSTLYEANDLRLAIDKAQRKLNWVPRWKFSETIKNTIMWYKSFYENPKFAKDLCLKNIYTFLGNKIL